MEQGYGATYVRDVLRGANTQVVRQRGHDQLSTFGLLRALHEKSITNIIYQLVDQGLLTRSEGERPVLQLSGESLDVLRGDRDVQLVEPGAVPIHKTKLAEDAWAGVDRGLFDHLRELRRTIAAERSVPAYVIFSDAVLRELARVRPTRVEHMQRVQGVGEKKLADLGQLFVDAIDAYCQLHALNTDEMVDVIVRPQSAKANPVKDKAMALFAKGASIDDVAEQTGRATSTIAGYLVEYVQHMQPETVSPWVSQEEYDRVVDAATQLNAGRLRPIYEHLQEQVPYEVIRVVLAHQAQRAERSSAS
jgi:ATP-dependent DNA helicase RecQ